MDALFRLLETFWFSQESKSKFRVNLESGGKNCNLHVNTKTIKQISRWPKIASWIYIWWCLNYDYFLNKSYVGICKYESFINDEVNLYRGRSVPYSTIYIPNTDLLDGLHHLKTKENSIFHCYFKSLCSDVIISHL